MWDLPMFKKLSKKQDDTKSWKLFWKHLGKFKVINHAYEKIIDKYM